MTDNALHINATDIADDVDMVDDRGSAIEVDVDNFDYIVNGYLMPVVCAIGCVAALTCVIVFTRPQMRSNVLNVYLAGLSVFDFMVLLFGLLIYTPMAHCFKAYTSDRANDQDPGVVCLFFWISSVVTFPLSLVAQVGSVWTCVAITVDRLLAVKFPFRARLWSTPQRAVTILGVIFACSILFKVPAFFELELHRNTSKVGPSSLRINPTYILLYLTCAYWLLVFLIPWTMMMSMNVIIMRAVHKAYRDRRIMTQSQKQNVGDDKEWRCTVMAIVIILTFVIFNLPSAICVFLEPLIERGPRPNTGQTIYRLLGTLGNLFVCINSASNFVVYSLLNPRFRFMCVYLFCRCVCRDRVQEYESSALAPRGSRLPSARGRQSNKNSSLSATSPRINNNHSSSAASADRLKSTRLSVMSDTNNFEERPLLHLHPKSSLGGEIVKHRPKWKTRQEAGSDNLCSAVAQGVIEADKCKRAPGELTVLKRSNLALRPLTHERPSISLGNGETTMKDYMAMIENENGVQSAIMTCVTAPVTPDAPQQPTSDMHLLQL